jgi:cyclic pyranopterin monophosphate synthase
MNRHTNQHRKPPAPTSFSHLDPKGAAHMVDVGDKPIQTRIAVATAQLSCQPATLRALRDRALPKGDVLAVANIAGIQAAKRTSDLIPLCHPLPIDQVILGFSLRRNHIHLTCTVKTQARTGAEMEALTGASIAALTLYDMCKAIDRTMKIQSVQLLEKHKS